MCHEDLQKIFKYVIAFFDHTIICGHRTEEKQNQAYKKGYSKLKYPNSKHNIGKFAAGIDLELVPGRSQNLICGMNTNGMNTSIYATFDGTATENATVDAWCEYDAFINISPGIASTVSF